MKDLDHLAAPTADALETLVGDNFVAGGGSSRTPDEARSLFDHVIAEVAARHELGASDADLFRLLTFAGLDALTTVFHSLTDLVLDLRQAEAERQAGATVQ